MLERIYERLTKNVYIIAEMSANHAGKLENALEIVRRSALAGADCVKIQTYTADTMTLNSQKECFKVKGGLWDGCQLYDLYQEAFTPWEWHQAIKEECEKYHVDFLSTPFNKSSADFLEELGVTFYKISSFELTDIPLIEHVAKKGKPMIISCGMGTIHEIQDAIDTCKRVGNEEIILLKCCSSYPADYSDMNLMTIKDMKDRFKLPIGLSDHSFGSVGAIVGVSMGACIVEKHICISREIKNPDSEFSMEIEEFTEMVEVVRSAKVICGDTSYERTQKEQASTKFRRSIFAKEEIKIGDVFTEDNICVLRPSVGLAPKYFPALLGKRAKRDISFAESLGEEDL